MSTSGLNPIAHQLVAPSDQDWIVRFKMADGTVIAKRVSPSTVTPEFAVSRAYSALGRRGRDVVDCDAFRYAATRTLVVPTGAGGASDPNR